MSLLKFKDFYPDYKDMANDGGLDMDDLKKFDVYAQGDEKVGSVHDLLVDSRDGRFRYFVVDTGFWIFGKKVLVPVGMTRIDHDDRRIFVQGLTRDQVEHLPNFDDLEKVDLDYEERVRGTYRPAGTTGMAPNLASPAQPLVDQPVATPIGDAGTSTYDQGYAYDRDPDLYNLNDRDQQRLKLYQERLIASKQRQRAGEVTIGKHVETETSRVAVPVEREKIVIDRTPVTDQTPIAPDQAAFHDREVARVEVYEETPDIHKETVVREEVQVRKVAEQEVVQAEDQVRREELDVRTEGNSVIDKRI